MRYEQVVQGIFLERPNRFVAYCEIEGQVHKCHVKNTGRCRELLVPGAQVYLEKSDNPARKTAFSLVSVEKDGQIIQIDSQAPNKIAYEAISSGAYTPVGLAGKLLEINREVTFGNSRFDLFVRTDKMEGFIEVKGVTLRQGRVAKFPDAPTTRGTKHVLELAQAKKQGYYAGVLFVLQMTNCSVLTTNWDTDPAFSKAILQAKQAGVQVQAVDCKVDGAGAAYHGPVPLLFYTPAGERDSEK